MLTKRFFDVFCAVSGLLFLAPVMLLIALLVRMDSDGPVLFRQVRVGRGGRDFVILKFRSMADRPVSTGPGVSASDDARITRVGKFLRTSKLDELPQLFNVLRGDMSIVGPRPELRRFVEFYPDDAKRAVFSLRPGITDPASVIYRNEEKLLAGAQDVEGFYVREILPNKIRMHVDYVGSRSFWGDVMIIVRTLRIVAVADNSRRSVNIDKGHG
jgi:lipopolysaccharide/colanic/teichoic acid biosynthesis glycosyltransferase